MKPIIQIRGLGKQYRLGPRLRTRTLREAVTDTLSAPARYARSRFGSGPRSSRRSPACETIWALRELDLDVGEGEVLGIIGSNGAGKSTLLKILSRITEPTTGRVDLYGRVGSLLEVGTGFHPELSGRENIYLSGAILGMRRAEIERKFDAIVAFAEVAKFIDTPVKHYSSGMYVRLAFGVAAHLEPEILLVDEVLAVGDASFQKKCLGKMGDVAKQGRTVIFVSHNMAAIESLCGACVCLTAGRLAASGHPRDVIANYLTAQTGANSGRAALGEHPGRSPGSRPIMLTIELRSRADTATGAIRMGEPLTILVGFQSPAPIRPVLGIAVKTIQGAPVFAVSDRYARQLSGCQSASRATLACEIESLPLMPGQYSIDLYLGDPAADLDVIRDAASFEVLPADLLGTGRLPASSLGPVFCTANWKLREIGEA